jgi:hypothetical protein
MNLRFYEYCYVFFPYSIQASKANGILEQSYFLCKMRVFVWMCMGGMLFCTQLVYMSISVPMEPSFIIKYVCSAIL